MPYILRKDGSKWKILKKKTGALVSTHPDRASAVRHMRAIYAHIPAKYTHKDMSVYREKSGKYRWLSISSTAYEDRDREIVSMKALQDDVARADKERSYGPLLWWHIPGARLGETDFNMLVNDRILVESGTIDDPDVGDILSKRTKDFQLSLGFYHPITEPDSNGVFHTIKRYERSLLPTGVASNLLTSFSMQGDSMSTRKDKEDELAKLVGDDKAKEILEQAEQVDSEALSRKMAFKEKAKPPKSLSDEEKPEEEMPEEEPAEDGAEPEEDDEEEDDEEMKEFVSDLSLADFAEVLASGIETALEPIMATVKEQQQKIATLEKEAGSRRKETSAESEQLTALVTSMSKRIKELEKGMPSAVKKGYLASLDDETIVPEDSALKNSKPTGDPISSFASWALGQ